MTVNTANTFQCFTVADLPQISFIAGGEQTFEFEVLDATGAPLDLTSATCSWVMSPYGDASHATLDLPGVISGSPSNIFTVTVSGSSTKNLSGKYTHQPKIVDFSGKPLNPSMGYINIIPENLSA